MVRQHRREHLTDSEIQAVVLAAVAILPPIPRKR
jgi:hypothetical protein